MALKQDLEFLPKTSINGGTEVTCVCFYLSRAHDILSRAHELISRTHEILSQSENTKYIHERCLK